MFAQFQANYQRVEQCLDRLTESIAAYNPSTTAASDLEAAESVVNDDLERLIVHQTNHARIEELRKTTQSLDQTLRKTIKLLADTRKEVLSIPSSSASEEGRREVKVDDLLAYAKFIAKTSTRPPSSNSEAIPSVVKKEDEDTHITNGIATPHVVAQNMDSTQQANGAAGGTTASKGGSNRFVQQWPPQEAIQSGALGDIQRLIDIGQDPGSVLTEEERAAAEIERGDREEKERLAQEEAERRRSSMFDTAAMRRRETMADVFDPDNL